MVKDMYSTYRHPKTRNEMRQYFDDIVSDFVKIRGKRAPNNLPNHWDDIPRSERRVETRRQKLHARPNYRESIRFFPEDNYFSSVETSAPWN